MKLARQYHLLRGNADKHVVVSRARSFHGASLGALSLSGVPMRRAPFAPYLLGEPQMLPAYCYRCPLGLPYPACDWPARRTSSGSIAEVGADADLGVHRRADRRRRGARHDAAARLLRAHPRDLRRSTTSSSSPTRS